MLSQYYSICIICAFIIVYKLEINIIKTNSLMILIFKNSEYPKQIQKRASLYLISQI